MPSLRDGYAVLPEFPSHFSEVKEMRNGYEKGRSSRVVNSNRSLEFFTLILIIWHCNQVKYIPCSISREFTPISIGPTYTGRFSHFIWCKSTKGSLKKMETSQRIRDLREDQNLSQKQVADILFIGQRTYSDYETGRTRIPIESLIKLALLYNKSLDYVSGASKVAAPFPRK